MANASAISPIPPYSRVTCCCRTSASPRHGRWIFYDYDELCRVTDCNFRDVPPPTHEEDEMRGEAWFYVADNDIFPETFLNFLAFSDEQRAALLRVHGEILTAGFWRSVQQRLAEGEGLEMRAH